MTQDKITAILDALKILVRDKITSQTEVDSITPIIHGGVLEEILNFLQSVASENWLTLLQVAGVFSTPPSDNILPTLEDGESRIYFITKAGGYKTEDSTQSITINRGEKALVLYTNEDGENVWKKISLETIANDITNESYDTPASQYLVKSIRTELIDQINEIKEKGYATSEEMNNSFVRLNLANTSNYDLNNDFIWQTGYFYFYDTYTGTPYKITGKLLQSIFLSAGTTNIVYKKSYLEMQQTSRTRVATIKDTNVVGFQFATSKVTVNGITLYPTIDYTLNSDNLSITLTEKHIAFDEDDKVVLECYLTDGSGSVITT